MDEFGVNAIIVNVAALLKKAAPQAIRDITRTGHAWHRSGDVWHNITNVPTVANEDSYGGDATDAAWRLREIPCSEGQFAALRPRTLGVAE